MASCMRKVTNGLLWLAMAAAHLNMANDQSSGKFKYFSYGSNLLRERILISNPTAEYYGVGKLWGYAFTYDLPRAFVENNGSEDLWRGAVATIRPAGPEDYVYGVVWEIAIEQMKNLDAQEFLYDPLEVTVHMETGETILCRVYEMDKDSMNIKLPSPHYKKIVLAGAKQNSLPADYIQFLASFPDNGSKKVPSNYWTVIDKIKNFRAEKGVSVRKNDDTCSSEELDGCVIDPLEELIQFVEG